MALNNRGQGTTEYLIILAVIIVIALVVVGVMGWFPGLGTGITEQQSRTYWSSASPIAIKDWKIISTAFPEFTVQNMTTDTIKITDIKVDSTSISPVETSIAAGATAKIVGTTGTMCTSGRTYQYAVNTITYDVEGTGGLTGKVQTGTKPLVGICP